MARGAAAVAVVGLAIGLGNVLPAATPSETRTLLEPAIQNARLDSTPLDPRGLAATVEAVRRDAPERLWIAWEVPAVAEHDSCCWSSRRRGCCLDERDHGVSFSSTPRDASSDLLVLLRVSGGQVDRVAAYSGTCPIDAAGLPVRWLDDVDPGESVDLLSSLLADRRLGNGALAAIAFHAERRAGALLVDRARRGASRESRREALFWLAQRNEPGAAEILLEAATSDTDSQVREHAVFAISQLPDDTGTLLLLEMARDRELSAEVRKQALFWLAQSDDPRALDLLTAILRKN
jgi:HEAT repeats